MTGAVQVVALSGGVGYPSSTRGLTDLLLAAVTQGAGEAGVEVATRTVEVRDHAADVATATTLGMPSAALDEALRLVEGADLLIAASPIFRGSYAGIFKSFVDLVDPVAMRAKPVLLGATAGTERHQLVIDASMRPLFAYFGALVLPTAVFAATIDFGAGGLPTPALERRIARAGAEAVQYVRLT